nr:MAG TPA: hypothetical protein [Caudoviricetes sp.]
MIINKRKPRENHGVHFCLAGGGRPLWAAILLFIVATVCYTVFVYRDNITKKEELSCIFFGL